MTMSKKTSVESDYAAQLLSNGLMSWLQIAAVAVCVLINALDGFDVMVVAFTASSVAREWGLAPTDIGALFSAGLIGMSLGAVFVAPLGDRFGRRPMILGCQILIGVTMLLSAVTHSMWELAGTRVLTGIGIGGLLASINIMVAEYASQRRRTLCIGMMSLGYPIGAAIGGLFSIYLIQSFGWRSVYVFGGVAMLLVVPLTLWLLPESLSFLLLRRDETTLSKVNRLLQRMGRPLLTSLPPISHVKVEKSSIWRLLRGPHARTALVMSLMYASVMFTVYFVLNWVPKMLTEIGFSDTGGISASLIMNVTGAIACLLMGLMANWFGLRKVAILIFLGLFASTAWFGFAAGDSGELMAAVAATGFFLFSAIAVSYAIVPDVFPAEVRLTAMGACLAFGRLGGVAGPYLAGVLMASDWSRAAYCIALAAPMLIAALAIASVYRRGDIASAR